MNTVSFMLATMVSLLVPALFCTAIGCRRQNARADRAVYDAHHDDLTGAGNRRAFHLALRAAVTTATPRVCVVMVDVNDFKAVNDTHGHSAGDLVLRAVARRLTRLDPQAQAYRLGGDEFVLLVHADEATGIDIARRAWHAFDGNPISIGMTLLPVTISAGIAAHQPGLTADQVLHHADLALYDAKTHQDVCAYPTGHSTPPTNGRPGQRTRDRHDRHPQPRRDSGPPPRRSGGPAVRYRCVFDVTAAAVLLEHMQTASAHHRSHRETRDRLICPGALEICLYGGEAHLASNGFPGLYTNPTDPDTELTVPAHRTEGLTAIAAGHPYPSGPDLIEHLHPTAALAAAIQAQAPYGGSLVIDVDGPTVTGHVTCVGHTTSHH